MHVIICHNTQTNTQHLISLQVFGVRRSSLDCIGAVIKAVTFGNSIGASRIARLRRFRSGYATLPSSLVGGGSTPQIICEQRMRGIRDKCIDISICGNLITFWYMYKLIRYSVCMCSKCPDEPCIVLPYTTEPIQYWYCCWSWHSTAVEMLLHIVVPGVVGLAGLVHTSILKSIKKAKTWTECSF